MSALELLFAAVFMSGASLLVAQTRWGRRVPLTARLAPYRRGTSRESFGGVLSAVILPMAESVGDVLSSGLGVRDPLDIRLSRAGDSRSPSEFRTSQFTAAFVTLLVAAGVVVVTTPSLALSLAILIGVPLIAVLWSEHRLEVAAEATRTAMELELPVVAEQMGILLGAGYSLPAALSRLASRSSGSLSAGLRSVVEDIRRGTGEIPALQNWAATIGVPAIDSLVSVLALHHEATDLGQLISEEASSIRAEAHRKRIESIERRAQLVWIPVTVATLVPGLILLAVPFTAALSQVAGP